MTPSIYATTGAAWAATAATNWHGIIPFGTPLALTLRNPLGMAAGTSASVSCVSVPRDQATGLSQSCIVDTAQGMIAFTIPAPNARGVYQLIATLRNQDGVVLDVLTIGVFGVMP